MIGFEQYQGVLICISVINSPTNFCFVPGKGVSKIWNFKGNRF